MGGSGEQCGLLKKKTKPRIGESLKEGCRLLAGFVGNEVAH